MDAANVDISRGSAPIGAAGVRRDVACCSKEAQHNRGGGGQSCLRSAQASQLRGHNLDREEARNETCTIGKTTILD
jgi:hypothetical protein